MSTLFHPTPVHTPTNPLAALRARLHALLSDPFAVLHRYYWSAPWLEAKFDRKDEL